jgi:Fe2+ or Zn2+ uptake regulation protein
MPVRHTRQRQSILLAVKTSATGLTADAVFSSVKRGLPAVGRATVYRNLETLTKRGELFRFEGEDGVRRYYGHVFHEAVFRCQRCGKHEQIPGVMVPANIFSKQTILLSRLSAQGICASCTRALRKTGVRV